MTTAFTERLQQQHVGNLSEGEQQVCVRFRDLIHAGLSGHISFEHVLIGFWNDLSVLREFNYDVDSAIASGKFDPAAQKQAVMDKVRDHAQISGAEVTFLEDSDGLIDWVTRNGVSFSVVLGILGHDVSELARDEFDLEVTTGPKRCVFPKVTGWAKRNAEPVGEADEQA